MERAERLSRELSLDVFVKRDDVMEVGLGGSKVRKLEFIIAEALSRGYDVLITRGATRSNHVRLTATATRKADLDVYAVLTPPGDLAVQGNVLIDVIYGAKLIYVERGEEVNDLVNRLTDELRAKGRKPYVIPGGGASELGVLGYALVSVEIMQQALQLRFRPKIVHSTGSGATQAGPTLGLRLLGAEDVKVVGITDSTDASTIISRATELLNATVKMLKLDFKVTEDDFAVYDDYGFEGYGVITKEVIEVITHVARVEGLLLDTVYTAKVMYGLIDLVGKGVLKNENVVFIPTGGLPILFQYATDILPVLKSGGLL
ncbi:MAG: pyridoxal-phosphate dependent enzyme [Zestosphaera sp.]